ncbi:MAG: type I-U CRISPR-associated protein Csx17 [Myxococcota bacterium]|nr:type I-U CRISPR-associated protein Csx17 [Myxococcota bacterium]
MLRGHGLHDAAGSRDRSRCSRAVLRCGRLPAAADQLLDRLAELFDLPSGSPQARARAWLEASLFGETCYAMQKASPGQFVPGAGGLNATTGVEAEVRSNPWDFVLLLEGAVAFRAQTSKRLAAGLRGRAALPFVVQAQPSGHGTAGLEEAERGEQWLPLWPHPASWSEVQALVTEGRAQVGRRPARRAIDVVEAIGRLGVARGLSGFERHGYLQRNGKSIFAVPLGRVEAGERPHARLLDDVRGWMDALQRSARSTNDKTNVSAGFRIAVKRLADAAFGAALRSTDRRAWQQVLLAIADVEAIQVTGQQFEHGPCPPLSVEWLEAAADDSPEWRLAVALGSAARSYTDDGPDDPVRHHWLPLDEAGRRYDIRTEGGRSRLKDSPRVVAHGRDSMGDLVAVVERRILEAEYGAERHLPLVAAPGYGARTDDLVAWLMGEVDARRTVALARSLMAIHWARVPPRFGARKSRRSELPEAWVAIRLCGLPFALGERRVPLDRSMVRRLARGDAAGAVSLALARLRAAGFRPPLRGATTDPTTAARWAAALAFPIERPLAEDLLQRFLPTAIQEAR